MLIENNKSLQRLNTFGIDALAKYFVAFQSVEQLWEALSHSLLQSENKLILGGGSNILFTGNYNGAVLKNETRGIQVLKEDEEHIYVKAAAGENWHSFVLHCIGHEWAGIENLSLIPGCVGASPMQNIGAYGVEIKDVFHELEAFHIEDQKLVTFSKNDCLFGYRESVFKQKYKNQFVIMSVTFRLNKIAQLKTKYGAIEQELERMQVTVRNIKAVSDAVINIRSSKLPDPKLLGNAGSFFKNPVIGLEKYEQLHSQYPLLVAYPADEQNMKLAAGWLIESCGLKGKVLGNCGIHKDQALVLVNYGHASGQEIYDLSSMIIDTVYQKFGILLQREVNVI